MASPDAAAVAHIVVMGVSASGKSSVAAEIAASLGVSFVDADDLHSAANIAKMSAGLPLDDSDRTPWLDAVGQTLASEDGIVVACSALRRTYRDRLRVAAPQAIFVHLDGDYTVLSARAHARDGHFMPVALLQSQFATLEPLADDERGIRIDVDAPVDSIVRSALEWIDAHER